MLKRHPAGTPPLPGREDVSAAESLANGIAAADDDDVAAAARAALDTARAYLDELTARGYDCQTYYEPQLPSERSAVGQRRPEFSEIRLIARRTTVQHI
jgi:hypothetical protein